ncbi:PKD domain-containing protein [Desulfonema magnum]|nr:BACON domain-containing carbohydrate-binding protein [Desulfonema magnum]
MKIFIKLKFNVILSIFIFLSFWAGSAFADSFPETAIKSKYSSSSYAKGENAFYVSDSLLRGECTWYVYGRVIELSDSGYLDSSVRDQFEDAFWGKTGRHARNWPNTIFLGGSWTYSGDSPLPMDKRRKGLVAVWKFGTYGHVGFVEEVSSDKTRYRLSDFNRGNDKTHRDNWYDFVGTSDRLSGVFPYFFELDLGSGDETCAKGDPTVEMEYLRSKGVIEDVYKPGAKCPDSRAAFVHMMVRAIESVFGELNMSTSLPFTDMNDPDKWYYESVSKAYRAGLINDQPDHKFRPADNMPRKHAILMVQRAMEDNSFWNLPEPPAGYLGTFGDIDSLYSAEKAAIKMAKYYDVARGRSVDNFEPNEDIIRQESAWFIFRMMTIPRDLKVNSSEVKENESFKISWNSGSEVDIMVESSENLFESTTRVYGSTISESSAGSYYYRTRMEYRGAKGGWSDYVKVEVSEDTSGGDDPVEPRNRPPLKPTISGPDSGHTDQEYTFTASSSDPDGDAIEYRFHFFNNTGEWQNSNKVSFECKTAAPYIVKVQAKDSKGAESNWSSLHTINITRPNGAPSKPQLAGNNGMIEVGKTLSLRAKSLDPDGDAVSYIYDWGDGDTTNVPASENQVSASHIWDEAKTYIVKVRAKDTDGNESEWSETEISVYEPNLNFPTEPEVSGPRVGLINQPYTFIASSSDADGDSLEYSFDIFKPVGGWERVESEWGESNSYAYSWTQAGSYCVKAGVRDRSNTPFYSACHSITIYEEQPECKIKITNPAFDAPLGSCGHMSGQETRIKWKDEDGDTDADIISSDVYYSLDSGATWELIADDVEGYSCDWSKSEAFIHDDVIVKVISNYNTGCIAEVISDPFDVIDGRKPTVTVMSPDTDKFYVGDPVKIEWDAMCSSPDLYGIERIDLNFINDGNDRGTFVELRGDEVKEPYTWIPEGNQVTSNGQIKVKVWCENCEDNYEVSERFEIAHKYSSEDDCPWNESERAFIKPAKTPPLSGWEGGWGQEFDYPQVVVDDRGNIHVAAIYSDDFLASKSGVYPRQHHRKGETQIYYRKKVSGNWENQEQATEYEPAESFSIKLYMDYIKNLQLAVDSSGFPHLVYEYVSTNGDGPDIYYIRKTENGWKQPVDISRSSGTQSTSPKIAIDKDDNVYVFWHESHAGVHYRVKMRETERFGDSQLISQVYGANFDVMIDDEGLNIAGDNRRKAVYAHLNFKNNVWSSELLADFYIEYPLIYSLNGKIHITSTTPHRFNMFVKEESEGWNITGYDWPESEIRGYHLWSDKSGKVHLVYRGEDEGKTKMMERFYDGSNWSENYRVISPTWATASRHSARGDANNLLATAWVGRYDGDGEIYLSTIDYTPCVQENKTATLSVSQTTLNLPASSGEITLEITKEGAGSIDWTAETDLPGLTLTPDSGTDGGTIIVAYEANTAAEQNGTITITANGDTKTVQVTQASGLQPVLFIAPSSRPVSPDGSDELVFTVKNTGTGEMTWTAEIVNAPWLTIVSQNSTEGTLTVSCEESTGPERTGEIRITAPGATDSPKTVKIIQEALEPVLSLTPTMYPVSPAGNKVIFVIENTGNGTMGWTAEVAPDASSWLTIEGDDSGENDGMLFVRYKSNLGEARTGEIRITAPGATGSPGKLEIKQDAYGVTDGVVMDMDISTETIDPMVQASEDDEVWVGIVAQQVANLNLFQLDVKFPPEETAFVEGAEDNPGEGPDNFLKSQGGETIGLSAVETDDGTANVVNGVEGDNCDKAPDGSGHIGFLKFRVLGSDSDITLEPNNVAFMDCENNLKTVTDLTSGTISPFSRYDFNRDGTVDDVDLDLLRDHLNITEDDPEWDPKYNLKSVPNSSGKQVIDLWDMFEFTAELD